VEVTSISRHWPVLTGVAPAIGAPPTGGAFDQVIPLSVQPVATG
jgi:hypothetical protein